MKYIKKILIYILEKSLADFLLVPATELKIKSKSKLFGVSVEQCAELCVFEDSYLCRSFQHYTNISLCYLFAENLKDEIYIDLKKIQNPNSNYYSSIYCLNLFVSYEL